MKPYAISLAAGLVVGLLYGMLGVASPAPPVVALVGLLGILLGEQVLPVGRRLLGGTSFAAACRAAGAPLHVFGDLPGRHARGTAPTLAPTQERRS
ncbi:DUF1427 family protein [Lichenihabitans sp. Uapishka_5]|uniref:DUF1427 family protein n=1 Tax=Lichenihabitans sp. Uapishka_5 TaxID=3037302 RepID=UPI0029E7CF36|nr:DUF1427 family protein [Lichenihabitans sp. Uapishka_5]MDX7951831.1 DUF1427 family protein [Lichenihabitans sp. Uapishka_5]